MTRADGTQVSSPRICLSQLKAALESLGAI